MANHKNNDMAVSPVVATLVLIVVAVIGAVAVGTILGTFSSDVSKQANANGAADASANHILTAGSTSVLPASLVLAKSYEALHPGTQIDVQGGGSGAGVTAVGQGICDIGATSDYSKVTSGLTTYPNLQAYQIGARSVVWIANTASTATEANATEINKLLGGAAAAGNSTATKLVQRSDASGTEKAAAAFVGNATFSGDNAFDAMPAAQTVAASGNAGVLAEVNGNTAGNEIGFVDLGYVFDTTGKFLPTAGNIKVLAVQGTDGKHFGPAAAVAYVIPGASGATLRAQALQSVKDFQAGTPQVYTSGLTNYPQSLDSGLYYVTNGAPNSVVKSFIDYARSPNGGTDVQTAGDFSLLEIS